MSYDWQPNGPSVPPHDAGQPTKPNRSLVVLAIVLAGALIAAIAIAVPYFLGKREHRDLGTVNKQWQQLSSKIPEGQVVQLDWVQYMTEAGTPGPFRLRVHYLNEHGDISQLSLHEGAQPDRAIRPDDVPGKVSADQLRRLNAHEHSYFCEQGSFGGIAMRFLPDGEAMYMPGCGSAFNTAGEDFDSVLIGSRQFDIKDDDVLTASRTSLHLAKHMFSEGIGALEVTVNHRRVYGKPKNDCKPQVDFPVRQTTLRMGFLDCNAALKYDGELLDPAQFDPDQAVDAIKAAIDDSGFQPAINNALLLVPVSATEWRIAVSDLADPERSRVYDMTGQRIR